MLHGTKLTNTDLEHPASNPIGRVKGLFSEDELSKALNFANNLVA